MDRWIDRDGLLLNLDDYSSFYIERPVNGFYEVRAVLKGHAVNEYATGNARYNNRYTLISALPNRASAVELIQAIATIAGSTPLQERINAIRAAAEEQRHT